jgi:hypothetical protein
VHAANAPCASPQDRLHDVQGKLRRLPHAAPHTRHAPSDHERRTTGRTVALAACKRRKTALAATVRLGTPILLERKGRSADGGG